MIEKRVRQRDVTETIERSPGQRKRSPGRAAITKSGFVHLETTLAETGPTFFSRIDLSSFVTLYRMFRVSIQSLEIEGGGSGTGGLVMRLSRDGAVGFIGSGYGWTRMTAGLSPTVGESDASDQWAMMTGDLGDLSNSVAWKCSGVFNLYQPSDLTIWPRYDWEFTFIDPTNNVTTSWGGGVLRQLGGMINGIGFRFAAVLTPKAGPGCYVSLHGAR